MHITDLDVQDAVILPNQRARVVRALRRIGYDVTYDDVRDNPYVDMLGRALEPCFVSKRSLVYAAIIAAAPIRLPNWTK